MPTTELCALLPEMPSAGVYRELTGMCYGEHARGSTISDTFLESGFPGLLLYEFVHESEEEVYGVHAAPPRPTFGEKPSGDRTRAAPAETREGCRSRFRP